MVIGPGAVLWGYLDPVRGREQGSRRPLLVVSGRRYLELIDSLAIVVPVTTTDRGWPNHVRLAGDVNLPRPSFAMTEQVRVVTRDRLGGALGSVTSECLTDVRRWLVDFIEFDGSL